MAGDGAGGQKPGEGEAARTRGRTAKTTTKTISGAARGRGATGARGKTPSIAVRKACFLQALRDTGIVARAARVAGIGVTTVYQHRARSEQFARDWDAAIAEGLDELEDALLRRAKDGVEKPVYYQGSQVGSVRQYSDALGMFLLKARRPEIYARIERAGGDGETMTQDEAQVEVLRRLDRLSAANAGDEA